MAVSAAPVNGASTTQWSFDLPTNTLTLHGGVDPSSATTLHVNNPVVAHPEGRAFNPHIADVHHVIIDGYIEGITSLGHLFASMPNLQTLDGLERIDTSQVTSMWQMFSNSGAGHLDLRALDVSNVENFSSMFSGRSIFMGGPSSLFSIDVSTWDTGSAINMSAMFADLPHLVNLDVSGWNTSNVENMTNMFALSPGVSRAMVSLDVSNWDVGNVRYFSNMFLQNDPLGSNLTTLDVSNWNTGSAETMAMMFWNANGLTTLDVSNWDVSNVWNAFNMFHNASSLTTLDVSNWDTSSLEIAWQMFMNTSSLTVLDVSDWNTSNLTDAWGMFRGASSIELLDLSNWNTSNIGTTGPSGQSGGDINNMFTGMTNLRTLILGDNFEFIGTPGLPTPTLNGNPAFWRNVYTGTRANPQGAYHLTGPGLMARHNAGTVPTTETWVVSIPSVAVGNQNGILMAGQPGTVTFPVTTTSIANGSYTAIVANLPVGVTVQGPVVITNGQGTLTLVGDTSTLDGITNNLELTLENITHNGTTGSGVTSPAFTLTISDPYAPTISVGNQVGTLTAGQAGTVTFPITTTNIANGTYTVTVANLPNGVTVQGQVTITNGQGTLTLAGNTSTLAGTTNNLTLTLDGVTSAPFALIVSSPGGGGGGGGGTPSYNLVISKSTNAPNGEVSVGSTVTYTVSVRNSGSIASGNITIAADIPAGMTFVPGSAVVYINGVANNALVPTIVNGVPTWTISSIAAGTTVEVRYQVTVDELPAGIYEMFYRSSALVNGRRTNTVELVARIPGAPNGGGNQQNNQTTQPPAPTPTIPFNPTHHAYMVGDANGMVRPNAGITRAEVATIFFRLITDDYRAQMWTQQNSFADVQMNDWFNNAVSTMTNANVFTGMPDGTFQPQRAITRAEFAVAMTRFFEGLPMEGANMFPDVEGHWAAREINAAARMGWVTGFPNGNFAPDQAITRAEAAALINRILGRLPRTTADLLPGMVTWPDNANVNAWYYLYIQEASNSNAFVMQADGIHKTWTELLAPRNWQVLERPDSSPWDIIE